MRSGVTGIISCRKETMGTDTEGFDRTVGNNNPGAGTHTRAPRIGQAPADAPRTGRAPRVERAPRTERPVRENAEGAPDQSMSGRAPRQERPQRPPKLPKPEKAEKKPFFSFGKKRDAVSVDDIYDEHERKEAAKNAAVKGGAPLRARKEEVERLKPGDSGTFKVARTMTPTQARQQDAMNLSTDEMPADNYMPLQGGMQGVPQGYPQDYQQGYPQADQAAPGPDAGPVESEPLPEPENERPRGTGVKVDTAPIPVVSVLEETGAGDDGDDVFRDPSDRTRPAGRAREVSPATGSMPEIERQARPDSAGGIEPTAPEGRSVREASSTRGGVSRDGNYVRGEAGRQGEPVRTRPAQGTGARTAVQGGARGTTGARRTTAVRENRHVSDVGTRTRERRETLRNRTEERELERSENNRRRMEERDRRRIERNDDTGYDQPVSVGFFIALGGLLVVVAVSVISALKHVEMAQLTPMVLCIITLIMLIMGFFLGMIPTFVTLILAAVAMAVGAITGYFSEIITALVILLGTVLAVKEWRRR